MAQQSGVAIEENEALSAGPQGRKRGDSSADRLERLLGAISTYSYSKSPAAPIDSHTEETSKTSRESRVVKGEEAPFVAGDPSKTARAMSSYTQRKRREYLLRKHASAEEEGDDDDDNPKDQSVLSLRERVKSMPVAEIEETVAPTAATTANMTTTEASDSASPMPRKKQPSSHSVNSAGTPLTSPKPSVPRKTPSKKNRKQRTNKHKKRKPRPIDGTAGIPHPGVYDSHLPHQSYAPQEQMSQQSLRALLASLLALDDRLSREMISQQDMN
jgi:hypothetical protein